MGQSSGLTWMSCNMGLKLLDISLPEKMVQFAVKTGIPLLYLSLVHAKHSTYKTRSREHARLVSFTLVFVLGIWPLALDGRFLF